MSRIVTVILIYHSHRTMHILLGFLVQFTLHFLINCSMSLKATVDMINKLSFKDSVIPT
jgi:hypothetical protein